MMLLGLLALAPAIARADDACAADRAKFCADAKGLKGKNACMKEHEADLTDACKAQRANLGAAMDELHKDCEADAAKLCPGAKGPARGKCMKEHEAELSQPCKDARSKAHEMREAVHPDCAPDIAKLCSKVEAGAGRIQACLKEHEADLSPGCKDRLAKKAAKKAAKNPPPSDTPAAVPPAK
jgi:hypothetical protein